MMIYGKDVDLKTRIFGKTVEYRDKTGSTNEWAKELARAGGKEGVVVTAGAQSAGKGRLGRSWISDEGGLYMSMIIRPNGRQGEALTLLAALAVFYSLQKACGLDTQIKWPNDILWQGQKICGILAEGGIDENKIPFLVMGIGINVNQKKITAEFNTPAASLYNISHDEWERGAVAGAVLREWESLYNTYIRHSFSVFLDEYKNHCVSLGKEIKFMYEGEPKTGLAADVEEDGSLLVMLDGVSPVRVRSGEIIHVSRSREASL